MNTNSHGSVETDLVGKLQGLAFVHSDLQLQRASRWVHHQSTLTAQDSQTAGCPLLPCCTVALGTSVTPAPNLGILPGVCQK